jgi:3-oxoacyl-[acyl-carrier protein] reductase
MCNLLTGKVAIVTGAARGIGAAIARRFAAEGASVSLSYLTRMSEAEATLAAILDVGGNAAITQADVREELDVQRLFAETRARFGRVDIVVNNAAVNHRMTIGNLSVADFRRHFDVNVLGVLLVAKEAARSLERDGCILNVSSLSSMTPGAGSCLYGGSKAAVDGITATLAIELGQKGIRVNAINPGMTLTAQLDELPFVTPEFLSLVRGMTPLQRLGTAEEIAGAAVALCSHQTASWITGQCVRVSGGFR